MFDHSLHFSLPANVSLLHPVLITESQEGYEVYDGRQLAPGPVLPVVIQQPGEDGQVGQGEHHADRPQPRLPGPALGGGGAQQAGVNTEHLIQRGGSPCHVLS